MSNNFTIVAQTLASAVATAGTITVTYPDGYTEGDFTTYDWFLVTTGSAGGSNDVYSSKAGDFTVALGDSAATLTWKSATTLAAGTEISVQANIKGVGDLEAKSGKQDSVTVLKRVKPFERVRVVLGNAATADADGILNDASATDSATSYSSTDFETTYDTTNGLDVPRNLTATGTAGSNHVITVTGEDEYGDVIVENITLSGTTVIQGAKAFKKVTTVAVAAGASGDTFDLGWGDKLGLPIFVKQWNQIAAQYVDGDMIATNERVNIPFEIESTELLAGTSEYVVAPTYGFIKKMVTTVQTAIGTGGTLTVEVETVAVTGLAVVVADSATVGTIDSDEATSEFGSTGEVARDADIEIVGDAAFATTGALNGYIEFTPGGAFVAADETAPTATTGDVRGTITPPTSLAPNGSRVFELDVLVLDPQYTGLDNFDG